MKKFYTINELLTEEIETKNSTNHKLIQEPVIGKSYKVFNACFVLEGKLDKIKTTLGGNTVGWVSKKGNIIGVAYINKSSEWYEILK